LPPSTELTPSQHAAYSYLLVSLHERQEGVIERVADAIRELRPGHSVGFRRRHVVVIVNAYSNAWPILFPQHGAGRKHQRPIVLEPWQRSILEHHAAPFVRGCIESDGCRHRRIVSGRNCGLLSLHPRRTNRVTVSLARRAAVAKLDGLCCDSGDPDVLPRSADTSLALTP
jgi:hypothetical protein